MAKIDTLTGTTIAEPEQPTTETPTPAAAAGLAAVKDGSAHPYVIVRADQAACFAGELVDADYPKAQVLLRQARRLWYWEGANDLSELATTGTAKRSECKFGVPVEVVVLGVVEVISATDEARLSIESVPHWTTQ